MSTQSARLQEVRMHAQRIVELIDEMEVGRGDEKEPRREPGGSEEKSPFGPFADLFSAEGMTKFANGYQKWIEKNGKQAVVDLEELMSKFAERMAKETDE